MMIHRRVSNIICFLNNHPRGERVLQEQAGTDACESFRGVGTSSMPGRCYIGNIHLSDLKPWGGSKDTSQKNVCKQCWAYWILPNVGTILIGFLGHHYTLESYLNETFACFPIFPMHIRHS
uniref:Cytochrome b5 heme-binding domain-containing protein n=1 Tax=Oryctolagus cuniculus TaxID=9986 RepID=G1TUH3_RABIT